MAKCITITQDGSAENGIVLAVISGTPCVPFFIEAGVELDDPDLDDQYCVYLNMAFKPPVSHRQTSGGDKEYYISDVYYDPHQHVISRLRNPDPDTVLLCLRQVQSYEYGFTHSVIVWTSADGVHTDYLLLIPGASNRWIKINGKKVTLAVTN